MFVISILFIITKVSPARYDQHPSTCFSLVDDYLPTSLMTCGSNVVVVLPPVVFVVPL